MSIGLAGSHRVGKTTLCEAIERDANIEFLRTSTGPVIRNIGYDPAQDYPPEQRMEIQWEILRHYQELYAGNPNGEFVTDRTPADLLAYTLDSIGKEDVGIELSRSITKYADECMNTINRHFSVIVVVQPGIPLGDVKQTDKAPSLPIYMEKINALIKGVLMESAIKTPIYRLGRGVLDLDTRVDYVMACHENSLMKMLKYRDLAGEIH